MKMQNINAMDNKQWQQKQWQKHVVETIMITGRQYNFSLQTANSSCFWKKKTPESARCLYILQNIYLAS